MQYNIAKQRVAPRNPYAIRRDTSRPVSNNRRVIALLLSAGLAVGISSFKSIFSFAPIIGLTIFTITSIIIITKKPLIGLAFIMILLPIENLLPDIPYLSSLYLIIGFLTIISFIIVKSPTILPQSSKKFTNSYPLLYGLLLTVWITITYFEALLPTGGRIWTLTFLQLLAMAWMVKGMLNSIDSNRFVFIWFTISCCISAIAAILVGEISTDVFIRSGGLMSAANSSARYFVVALIMVIYLWVNQPKRTQNIHYLIAALILVMGTVYTGSRTGILLLLIAILLNIYIYRNILHLPVLSKIAILLITVAVIIPPAYLNFLQEKLIPSIVNKTDTVGLRFELWKAAINMWKDNPIAGVGIGNYQTLLPKYAATTLDQGHLRLVAHNGYISILAETGSVGLALYLLMFGSAGYLFYVANKTRFKHLNAINGAWQSIFMILLLGNLTTQGSYDKLLWFSMGSSIACYNMVQSYALSVKYSKTARIDLKGNPVHSFTKLINKKQTIVA